MHGSSDDDRNSAAATAEGLAALTAWSAALSWDDIPDPQRAATARIFCDDLSAIVAARDEPELRAMADQMALSSGVAEATVFDGRGRRFDRYSAALVNGSAADWCELDSGYRKAVCHGGLYCLPALLAEGEATGAALHEMLRALLIGYETVARVARAFTFSDLLLHPHATLAAVGAAATTAALRRCPPEHAAAAISTAATLVLPGPFNHAVDGALIRNVWPGMGASTGMRAVDWAGIGITGRAEALHDVFAVAFGANPDPGALSAGLGIEWAVDDGYHKLHACCQYSHAAVEASQEILATLDEPEPEVRRIHVDTHWRARKLDNPAPATTLAAKFSLQHVLATTARHGHADAEAFQAGTLADPAIASLREAVTIGAFEPVPDWPNDRPARVRWELADGRSIERTCLSARGGPDRPFTPAEMRAKILAIVGPPLPALAQGLDRILDLDAVLLDRNWADVVAG